MSLMELLVIILIMVLVIKPDDLPVMVKQLKSLKKSFTKIKSELLNLIDPEDAQELESEEHEIKQINYYVEKIASMNAEYYGDYNLKSIKSFYRKLVQEQKNKH